MELLEIHNCSCPSPCEKVEDEIPKHMKHQTASGRSIQWQPSLSLVHEVSKADTSETERRGFDALVASLLCITALLNAEVFFVKNARITRFNKVEFEKLAIPRNIPRWCHAFRKAYYSKWEQWAL